VASLRGTAVTKQSSYFPFAGLLRCARNDGKRSDDDRYSFTAPVIADT
jgi:hypothetical protein